VPGVSKAGGFTITSPPSKARAGTAATPSSAPTRVTSPHRTDPGYLELAVQKSPDNPPAAWLWQRPAASLLGRELQIRVGGSFVWPPSGVDSRALKRVVFVAGGVGVNPLVSMLSHIAEEVEGPAGFEVRFLYSVRDPGSGRRRAGEILFLERIRRAFDGGRVRGGLKLFLTGAPDERGSIPLCDEAAGSGVPFEGRRISARDLEDAVGSPADRTSAVVYVCGVPTMTDEFVRELTREDGLGMAAHRVLCEKWW
jgi:hypothetical protein